MKALHALGYVHGDLKLHNMCHGIEDKRVRLIDFGVSHKYIDELGKHKVDFNNDKKKMVGNLMFASVNICKGH